MSAPKGKESMVTGVVAVFIDENGHPIADAADFNRSGYGGYTLRESQEVRARDALNLKVCAAYASPQLTRAIDRSYAGQIVQALVRDHGCKVHVIEVGKP